MGTSEKLRQREVHRFYQAWLESANGFDDLASTGSTRHHSDGSRFSATRDRALTAFAQLGCLRMNAKRCIVTLIDSVTQYIMAESTRTLSLVSNTGGQGADDEIWFGNASIPRTQGMSQDALAPPDYEADESDGSKFKAPALVVPDVTKHPVYKHREYAGQGVSFYCGVPITTKTGFTIGVYLVADDVPRHEVTADEIRFMQEMSAIVMQHFESIKNEAARFRGETLILGLGRFIQGAATLRDEHTTPVASPVQDEYPSLSQPGSPFSQRKFKGLTITAADPARLRPLAKSVNSDGPDAHHVIRSSHDVDHSLSGAGLQPAADVSAKDTVTIANISTGSSTINGGARSMSAKPPITSDQSFSRAASILRQCTGADGVIFFSAISANSIKRSGKFDFQSEGDQSDAHPDDSKNKPFNRQDLRIHTKAERLGRGSVSSDDSERSSAEHGEDTTCRLLGYSVDISSQSGSTANSLADFEVNDRTMKQLIRHYPHGKAFNFAQKGSLITSDGSQGTTATSGTAKSSDETRTISSQDSRRKINRTIARELLRIVPYAQSVVWLPIWDFLKQRWIAGTFLWTRSSGRMISAQEDLVYLKTFANSIMMEVARVDATSSDRAKSTFIANVSHELRTPLHGILGNLDILQDTDLDDFQSTLATAIEVSSKTLTDTIDHILDYTKINQLMKDGRRKPDRRHQVDRNSIARVGEGDGFDLAVVVEEVVETVCASYAFQSKGKSKLDQGYTVDSKRRSGTSEHANRKLTDVQVILEIQSQESWWVRAQPGAIRRILTNLVGNALKYTDKGIIKVSLNTPQATNDEATNLEFELTVIDTGQGMSKEFVANHAFVPFQQESSFSIGTGLGLSIVQQIVHSLHGQVKLKSEQGTGTEMQVSLSLPRVSLAERDFDDKEISADLLQKAPGLSMCLINLGNGQHELGAESQQFAVFDRATEATCQTWFGMTTSWASSAQGIVADIFLYTTPPSPEEFIKHHRKQAGAPNAPVIAVTTNAVEQAQVAATSASAVEELGLILEVISHPVGPYKLSRAFAKCLQRAGHWKSDPAPPKDEIAGLSKQERSSVLHRDPRDSAMPASPFLPADPLPPMQTSEEATPEEQNVLTDPNGRSSTASSSPTPPSTDNCADGPQARTARSGSPSKHAGTETHDASEGAQSDDPSRVLLVDDNHINLNILKQFMKRAKIEFDTAMNGLEAFEKYQKAYTTSEHRFTHILMDISMPVMDGVQATREIRSFESSQQQGRTLVIALSGVASEETQNEMYDAGADMFVPKPVRFKELIKILAAD